MPVVQVPKCPPAGTDGWWEYAEETNRLLEENARIIYSWRGFLPWEILWRTQKRLAVIRARNKAAWVALDEEVFG